MPKNSEILGTLHAFRSPPITLEATARHRRTVDARGERCLSTIERFVWDGDQLLYQTRYPGGAEVSANALDRAPPTAQSRDSLFGWLGYTHGPGIDVPLEIIRLNHPAEPFVVIPHYNYRGVADAGTDRTGNRVGLRAGAA